MYHNYIFNVSLYLLSALLFVYNHLFAIIYQISLSNRNNLYTVIRFHIFLSNINNLYILVSRVFTNSLGDQVQSQIKSYQRFKIWYLIPICLTLSIIRYISRVKRSNPGKGVVAIQNKTFRLPLTTITNFTYL